MLKIAASCDPVEVQIEGERSDLADLSAALRSGKSPSPWADFDPAPYDYALTKVFAILTGSGLVEVSVDHGDRSLTFQGGVGAMSVLADNVDGLMQHGESGDHVHVEYYSEHPYLSEHAQPFVLILS